MFVGITNTPRDYAWGSHGGISELLGVQASGGPEAELWLGAHPGSPSRIVGSDQTLLDLDARLPFLMKVLAADLPLSLQAHPTMEQAAAGFARENALGIPLDAPERNYRDPFHKPELIYALSEEFHALCGFRPVDEILELLASLPEAEPLAGRLRADGLKDTFEWLVTRGTGVDELVSAVSAGADPTARLLAAAFPGDPGIAVSLLLNHVTLTQGEALYLPAGNIHAYLSGVGIELMSSSDNVLRGGLTPKHVDVPELLSVLDFRPIPVPYLEPQHPSAGIEAFVPPVPEFQLLVVRGSATVTLHGAAIALCITGRFSLSGSASATVLARGESAWVSADEETVQIEGDGELFIATTQ